MRPKERLLRRGIPKIEIKKGLEAWADSLSGWEHAATLTVAIGLVMGLSASLVRFLPASVYLAVSPYLQRARDFGEALVTIGVVAEVIIGSKSGRVETDLRAENDRLVQEANQRADKASRDLERRVVSRELTEDEKRDFILALSSFPEQAFALIIPALTDAVMPPLDRRSEQLSFAASLEKLLIECGWVLDETSMYRFPASSSGITVFSPLLYREGDEPDPLDEPTGIVASTLAGQLIRLNISTQVTLSRNLPTGVVVMAIGLL